MAPPRPPPKLRLHRSNLEVYSFGRNVHDVTFYYRLRRFTVLIKFDNCELHDHRNIVYIKHRSKTQTNKEIYTPT